MLCTIPFQNATKDFICPRAKPNFQESSRATPPSAYHLRSKAKSLKKVESLCPVIFIPSFLPLLPIAPDFSTTRSTSTLTHQEEKETTKIFGNLEPEILMSSDYALPIPESRIIVGFGGVGVDILAAVRCFPKPDSKIRSTDLKVQGGGNTGNALTCAARLGLKPRIISKIANDTQGRALLEELEADGVDTSFVVVSKEGTTPFSYIIVDSQMKTRTCIYTPGYPPMIPEDLPQTSLLSALDGARVVYFDVRLPETALVIAHEAFRQNIPIFVDAERPREGLDDLLKMADYVVCSENFPQAWTEASSIPRALVSIMLRLPRLKFVIATLGKDGCIMLEQCVDENSLLEEMDIDSTFESLKRGKDDSTAMPTCIASSVTRFRAEGIGSMYGRLYFGTAEKIPPSELVDTTGAGDAFVGAVLYAICANFSPQIMLPLASYVAAANCKAFGARSGLPYRTDPHLASFTQHK